MDEHSLIDFSLIFTYDFSLHVVNRSFTRRHFAMLAQPGCLSNVLVLVGAPGAILTSLISLLGLYHQNRIVWKERSAHSLSAGLFMALAAVFLTGTAYGIACERTLMVAANVARVPYALLIFVGIACFGQITWRALGYIIPLSILSGIPFLFPRAANECVIISGAIATGFSVSQIIGVIRQRSAGQLSFVYTMSALLGTVFWALYLSNSHWSLVTLCLLNVVVSTVLVGVSWRFRKNQAALLRDELLGALPLLLGRLRLGA